MNNRPNPPTYELHPLCVLFPRMAGAAFDALREDVRANGLRTPIVLHGGMILDGGNRYRACIEAGVMPEFVQLAGGNLASFVLSANLHRRHMSPGQQAAIVASAQDWAHAHKQGGTGANQHAEQAGDVTGLQTVADRAAQSGASDKTQRMADKVAKADPDLALKVAHGEVSLPRAHAQVSKPAKPAPAPVPAPHPIGEPEALDDHAPPPPDYGEVEAIDEKALVKHINDLLAENTRMGEVFDADDRLAAAMAANAKLTKETAQLTAQVNGLLERVNGLMNEKNAVIRRVKALEYKLKKAGLA